MESVAIKTYLDDEVLKGGLVLGVLGASNIFGKFISGFLPEAADELFADLHFLESGLVDLGGAFTEG